MKRRHPSNILLLLSRTVLPRSSLLLRRPVWSSTDHVTQHSQLHAGLTRGKQGESARWHGVGGFKNNRPLSDFIAQLHCTERELALHRSAVKTNTCSAPWFKI